MNHMLVMDSITEIMDRVGDINTEPFEGASSRDKTNNEWAGSSLETAMQRLEYGWPEGTAKLREVFTESFGVMRDRDGGFTVTPDVAGSYPDVGKYLSGDPENMVTFTPKPKHKPVCSIAVNIATSAGVDPDAMMRRGVVVCALIDHLENQGVRVEVDVVQAVRGYNGDTLEVYIPVKYADQHLDMDRVAFMLANPAMLRKVIFALEETLAEDVREAIGIKVYGGYGVPADIEDDHIAEYDLYIPKIGMGSEWKNPRQKMDAILANLIANGVIPNAES